MPEDRIQVILGAEWDSPIRARLLQALHDLGASQVELSTGVGGSQEVSFMRVKLDDETLDIVSETYMGLSITGPSTIVDRILGLIKPRDP